MTTERSGRPTVKEHEARIAALEERLAKTQPMRAVNPEKSHRRRNLVATAVVSAGTITAVGLVSWILGKSSDNTKNSADLEARQAWLNATQVSSITPTDMPSPTNTLMAVPSATLTFAPNLMPPTVAKEFQPFTPEPQKWVKPEVVDPVISEGIQIYTLDYFDIKEAARAVCVYDGTCNIPGVLSQEDLDALAGAKAHTTKNFGETSGTVPGTLQMYDQGIFYQITMDGVMYASTTTSFGWASLENGNYLMIIKSLPSKNNIYPQTAYERKRKRFYLGQRKLSEGEAMFVAYEVDPFMNVVAGKERLEAGACANPAGKLKEFPKKFIPPTPVNTPVVPVIPGATNTPVPPGPTEQPRPTDTPKKQDTPVPTVTQAATQPPQPTRTPGGDGSTPVVNTPLPTEAPVVQVSPARPPETAPSSTPSF